MKYSIVRPLLFSLVHSEKIIKNLNIPACRNCIHYIPSSFTTDFTYPYNECGKFGVKNIVTDKIEYSIASSCREDKEKCGKEGKYFEEEPNIGWKITKHNVKSRNALAVVGSTYIFLVVSFVYSLLDKNNR